MIDIRGEIFEDQFIRVRVNIIRRILIDELKKLRARLNKSPKISPRILDIGCGSGQFLRLAETLGFECYGIDFSESAISRASKATSGKLYLRDIQNGSGFPNEYFDICLCLEILEHLKGAVDVLFDIHRILKPHGLLIISTPNANSLARIISPSKNSCINDPQHILLFTPFTLSLLISKLGFKIEKCETYFVTLPITLNKIVKNTKLGGSIFLLARK
jgi:SAM-dependent methyltransferase